MVSKVIAETKRLRLREVNDDDAENLISMFSDPEVMRFYPQRGRAETLSWIEYSQANYRKYGHSKWIIEDRNTNEFIGYCGLLILNIQGTDEVELGYMLKRSKWGCGYATEAAQVCLRVALEKFGYNRVTSIMAADNEASQEVSKRIGMVLEKTFVDDSGVERLLFAKAISSDLE